MTGMRGYESYVITGFRALLVAPLFYCIVAGYGAVSLGLVALAVFTDYLDGVAARRLGKRLKDGSLFDACTDFLVVFAGYMGYAVSGVYGTWVLGVLLFVFTQFLASRRSGRLMYDPLGKYIGVVAMLMLLPPLLLKPSLAAYGQWVLLLYVAASTASRWGTRQLGWTR